MLGVFLADLDRVGIGFGVVIAVGQSEAAGVGEGDHGAGVGVVLAGAEIEHHAGGVERQVLRGEERGQIFERFERGDLAQDGFNGGGAGLFDGRFIHAGVEKVADFLGVRRARGIGFARLQQQSPEEELIVVL